MCLYQNIKEIDTQSGKGALPLTFTMALVWLIDLIQPLKYIVDEAKVSIFCEVLINFWLPKGIVYALDG